LADPVEPVGVPAGVARVIVAVAAQVVEILTQQPADQRLEPWMVQQRAEPLPLVNERHDARTLRAIVDHVSVAEDRLELLRDPADVIGQQAGQDQVAERLEEMLLLRGQKSHALPPFTAPERRRCFLAARIRWPAPPTLPGPPPTRLQRPP